MKQRLLNCNLRKVWGTRLGIFVLALILFPGIINAQTTVTITATGTTGSYKTGSVSSSGTKNDGDMITINQTANRGWANFDLTSIPAGAIIVSANALFTTYSSVSSAATNNLYGFTGDPFSMSGTALYTACGAGTSFNAATWTANALNTKTINATGLNFIQTGFGGFVNIGYVRGSTNTYNIAGYPAVSGAAPQLVITYNVPPACSGTPSPGATNANPASVCTNGSVVLSLPSLSSALGYTYQWQSSPDNITWTNIPGATNATYGTTLTVTTYFQCIVTCSNTSLSATSTPVQVTVGLSAVCYCSSIPSFTADEEITNVTLNNLNNSSTCTSVGPGPNSQAALYANYTTGPGAPAAVQITQGYTMPFSVTVGSCGTTNYTSGMAIFIDYNQDGDYLDAGENVYNNGSTANINCIPATIVTGNFVVPLSALTGTTYMRIIDAEGYAGTSITPCLAYGYGETEDYLVTVLPAPAIDMGASALASPMTTGCHSNNETVSITLTNYSTTTINFATNPVTVNASVTGPNPVTFTPVVVNSGTLSSLATLNVVITSTYNMSAAGTYTFSANTSVAGDGGPSNDAMTSVAITTAGGTATALQSAVCSGSGVDLVLTNQTNGGTVQWQSSPDGITWTNIPGATTNPYNTIPTGTTFYRAVVCGVFNSTMDTVSTVSVAPATAINNTRCGPGTVTLGATASDSVFWYTQATGGTPVHIGSTYSASVLSTDTFFVENVFTSCGPGGMPVAATCYPTYSSACSSADFINNFSTTGGGTNISNLNTGCNGTAPTNSIFYPTQSVSSTPGGSFNFAVQSGSSWSQGFHIWIDYNNDGDFVDPGEDIWSSPSTGTGVYTGTVNVPSNTAPGPKRIRVMCRFANIPSATDVCSSTLSFGEVEEYTLNVCTQCSSSRTAVVATVTAPPAITASSVNSSLCGSDSTQFNVTSSNNNYNYLWSPSTYLSDSTIANPMWVPSVPGTFTYYVDAADPVSGCANRDTVVVSSSAAPVFAMAASTDTICSGTPTSVYAVLPSPFSTIGTGATQNTSTTYPAPYGQFYGGSRHQMLILASEMSAAGMSAGYYTGMNFEVTSTNTTAPLLNFTISIGNTTVTDLAAGFISVPMTQYYTNPSYMPIVGTNTHSFATPFYWDGVSNIVVETCFANYTSYPNTTFTTNCNMMQTFTPFVSTAYNRYDNTANICSIANQFTSSQRPDMTFIRVASALSYAWSPALTLSNPASDSTAATPSSSVTYYLTVTDSLSGCTKMDSIHVVVNPTPHPMLGADTAICSNTVLTLDASAGPNYTYLWQDASTTQMYSVNAFGNYAVLVTDSVSGCAGSDTILVGINAAPAFSLGSDVTICAGNNVTFSGPGGYIYDWSTGDSTQTITTGTASPYVLTLTDMVNNCFSSDTVMLNVNPLPAVALGSDTAICSANAPLTLNAPSGNYAYMWSDSTTNSSLMVNNTGSYYVVVTDNATTCYSGDTIIITVNTSPVVTLGNDTTFCSANGPITLNGPAGPYNYAWSNFSSNMSLTTNTSGPYSLTATDSVTGCAASDLVNVTVNQSPVVNLGNDTMLCGGTLVLDAGNQGSTYMWMDSTSAQTLTASMTALYSVDVVSTAGCGASDSIMVTINTPPTVTFTTQTAACTTDPAFSLTGSPAGGTFSGNGVSGNTFTPSVAGPGTQVITYSYTDANGCTGVATSSIDVGACVGITEPFMAAGMNVYPNPNNGLFTLTIKDADYSKLSIELMSVDGKTVYSDMASNVKGNYVKQLDLTQEANGIYFLRITANGETFMQKVVKND